MIFFCAFLTLKVFLSFGIFPFTYTIKEIFIGALHGCRLLLLLLLFFSLFLFFILLDILFPLHWFLLYLFFHVDIRYFTFILNFDFLRSWDDRLLVLSNWEWRIKCTLHILVRYMIVIGYSIKWREGCLVGTHWRHDWREPWHHPEIWNTIIKDSRF